MSVPPCSLSSRAGWSCSSSILSPPGYGEFPKQDPGWKQGPCTWLTHPMAIMSTSFVSPVLRCRSDVTSFGGMAVPTFQVTTVMLGRNEKEQA